MKSKTSNVIPGFSQEDLEKLVQKGYDPATAHVFARDGLTRDVYNITFRSDDLVIKRAMKVPKQDIGSTSITTLINYVNNGINENEVRCLQELDHPNISRIVDTLRKKDGSIVNFEELVEGVSLKNYVNNHGVFDLKRMKAVFLKVIDGMGYMNETKHFLHRDIKPSNILYNPLTGDVKVSDLENAKKIDEIKAKNLATRGGTTYTHPELLNAILGEPDSASFKTDVYALVNTMYHALIGNDAFDYKIDYDSEGKQINVGDRQIRVSLYSKGDKMEKITPELHEKNKKQALKKLPRAWRRFFKKGLSMEGYESMTELSGAFGKAVNNVEKWQNMKRKGPLAAVAAIALTAIIATSIPRVADYRVVEREELTNKTWKSESFDRDSSSGKYYEIFERAYDNVKLDIIEGKVVSRFDMGDKFIDETADKYGLDSRTLKNMSRCIKVVANEYGGYWYHGLKMKDVFLLDPFIADGPRNERITDLKENWEKGAEKLSVLLKKNGGDYTKALFEFYDPIKKVENGFSSHYEWAQGGSSLDEEYIPALHKDVKTIVHNIMNTGMGYEVYDGGKSIGLEDPFLLADIRAREAQSKK